MASQAWGCPISYIHKYSPLVQWVPRGRRKFPSSRMSTQRNISFLWTIWKPVLVSLCNDIHNKNKIQLNNISSFKKFRILYNNMTVAQTHYGWVGWLSLSKSFPVLSTFPLWTIRFFSTRQHSISNFFIPTVCTQSHIQYHSMQLAMVTQILSNHGINWTPTATYSYSTELIPSWASRTVYLPRSSTIPLQKTFLTLMCVSPCYQQPISSIVNFLNCTRFFKPSAPSSSHFSPPRPTADWD